MAEEWKQTQRRVINGQDWFRDKKWQKVVEGHHCPYPERTWYMKEKE